MRQTVTTFSILFMGLILTSLASAGEALYLGHSETIHSKVLNEDRLLSIKLPEGYKTNTHQTYPVLYTLDGQTHFRRVAGMLEWLSDASRTIPQHIVVAIHNNNGEQRGRDTDVILRDGKVSADNHLAFLSKELIPYIDKTYRTSPYRILAGHSAQARFALHAYAKAESAFDAFIAMSPALPTRNDEITDFTKNLAKKIVKGQSSGSYLFMTLGREPGIQKNFDRLNKSLTKVAKKYSAWEVQSYPQETHMSVPSKTLHNAMLAISIHQGWTAPTKVINKGANSVIEHYKQVSKRLNKTVMPNPMIFVGLGWEAINDGSPTKAEKIFKAALKLYPKDAYMHAHLSSSYELSKQPSKAIEAITKAIALERAKANPVDMNTFKERLARLTR